MCLRYMLRGMALPEGGEGVRRGGRPGRPAGFESRARLFPWCRVLQGMRYGCWKNREDPCRWPGLAAASNLLLWILMLR